MPWHFGPFRLDLTNACVWRTGQRVPLRPKTLALLAYLVQHAGQLVTKEALLDAVWPETTVGDGALKTSMNDLRKALGDTGKTPQYITTVIRRGYRFVAPVVEYPEAPPGPSDTPPGTPPEPPPRPQGVLSPPRLPSAAAERRHLTVLCCALMPSTPLAAQLDPDDYREAVRAYHQVCAEVMQRFEGYVAQYLGDGVLVYFGYPLAHEDDAQRAVRAGLALLDAVTSLALALREPVTVRLGAHTGLAVVDDVEVGSHHEPLALGETPHIATWLPYLAEPNTLVVSTATQQLVDGYVRCKALGAHTLPGLTQALEVYRILGVSGVHSRLEVAATHGLTPLVGRGQEVGLLQERWARVREGMGQVVLLRGEAGIGKSRLAQELKEHVADTGRAWLEGQGSPYHQYTAFFPLTVLLTRYLLPSAPAATTAQQVQHLEAFLAEYDLTPAETVPLLAPLLALPLPATYAPVQVPPDRQRQQTLHALVRLVLRLADAQPLLLILEDLHWFDPSTLEWLRLLVEQGPTARILTLCTCRPGFQPPWTGRSHLTQITLARLPRNQATELTHQVAQGRTLPAAVVAQIVAQTDGVPLFVEEVTRAVLQSGPLQAPEAPTGPTPPLAIPATLHDALLAQLDRLGTAKGLAQLGATLGREFPYPLLQAVAPRDEESVRQELQQLVRAELLYQRGLPPQATYTFKHALIQEAAYQSLLRSTRQQFHQRIARVIEAQFPTTVETQPELLAQHYTAAGFIGQALPYWEQAGKRATRHSAYVEAVSHLTTGLRLLKTLPDTPERLQQELTFQLALNHALLTVKGYAAPEVEETVLRIQELCQHLGETPQICTILYSLFLFYMIRGEFQTMRQLAEQYCHLARRIRDVHHLTVALTALGWTLYLLGEFTSARTHVEQAMALYASQSHPLPTVGTDDPRVDFLSVAAWILERLGYPDQARKQGEAALDLAGSLSHPYSLAFASGFAAMLHVFRREEHAARARAEAVTALSAEQGFPYWSAWGTIVWGWSLARQGQVENGLARMQQGLEAYRALGAELGRTWFLAMLAEAHAAGGQIAAGLRVLTEALDVVNTRGERDFEAELYRLKGELTLQSRGQHRAGRVRQAHSPLRQTPVEAEAEACFWRAIETARGQSAKPLELRATMSLSRLWQQQGKKAEARQLLAPVCGWFTEGLHTTDLQDARGLLEALA